MSDAPERIWLQHNNPYDAREENTWADHAVGETEAETEYLRADLIDALLAEAVREGIGVAAKAAFNACRASQSGYKDENSRLLQRAESEMLLETQKAIRTADETAIAEAVKRLKETPDR